MAFIPRSSFIPKEATGAIPAQIQRRRSIHVFGLIATLMLTGAVVSSVGVFFYNDFLVDQLDAAKTRLGTKIDEGNEEKINKIRMYDNKLNIARDLLENHIFPSRIFEELEKSTKETVRFTTFDFTYDPGFEATLTLSGDTEELRSVFLQKAQISEDSIFSEFSVSSIASSITSSNEAVETVSGVSPETNEVSFAVIGTLNKNLLSYTETIRPVSIDESTEEQSAVLNEETQIPPESDVAESTNIDI